MHSNRQRRKTDLTNLRFADVIVLLADNLKDIKDMLQELQIGWSTNEYLKNKIYDKFST